MLLLVYAHAVQSRAETLAPLVVLAFFVGEFFARGPLNTILGELSKASRTLARKLDRENRSIATRVYRGMVAVLMLIIPAIALAAALGQPTPWVRLLSGILIVAWFGHCFASISTLGLVRRAKAGTLALELNGLNYLFADSHAVIRHLIRTRWNSFAIGVVGASLWYVLAGVMGMGIYLALASAHTAFAHRLAFGWAARSLFGLANALPVTIARGLMFLASLFTPRTKPFAGLTAPNWPTALANTLDCALGGPSPTGETPWAGNGTARVGPTHLRQAMQLLATSTVLLVLLLASPKLVNMLILII